MTWSERSHRYLYRCCLSFHRDQIRSKDEQNRRLHLPASLPCKLLVEMNEQLRHIELHVLEIEIFLAVFLHLEQVVELQVKFQ
jgi:hypothetical protein